MAYVASWIAPAGTKQGSKNMEQPPRNAFNINQSFVRNETVGYYKPPFCQWPFGGSTKREVKQRILTGEPLVKAGSGEELADAFYYSTGKFDKGKRDAATDKHSKFFNPSKDETGSEISVRTVSDTLYMCSNVATRTYGQHKTAKAFPFEAEPQRASFKRRPKVKQYPEGKAHFEKVKMFDLVRHEADAGEDAGGRGAGEVFMTKERRGEVEVRKAKVLDSLVLKPATPVKNPSNTRKSFREEGPGGGRFLGSRQYTCGTVPRILIAEDGETAEPVSPTGDILDKKCWQKKMGEKMTSKLLSPRTREAAIEELEKTFFKGVLQTV